MYIHHIGYAVKNINEAILQFEKLGYEKEGEMREGAEGGKLYVQFLLNQGTRVELVSPAETEGSPVDNVLNAIGCTPYHICYEVRNIREAIRFLKEENYKVIRKPEKTGVLNNYLIAFLYHKDMGVIEIVEKEK